MRALALPLVLAATLLAGASVLNLWLARAQTTRPYDVVHVPSGAAARVAALGHRTFLSDLYWLSAVQYIGEPRADQRGWDKLLPLVDLVTDLDPRHGYAYQTAGIVLSAAGLLDESDAILEKGIVKGPPYWTFPYYLAFNAWFYRGDYAAGAKWAEIAARTPGASVNVSRLALSLASKSGTPEDAIEMLREIRATVKDEETAERLDEQLKLAVLERDAQRLERAVARFREQRGRAPTSLAELVRAGLVESIPEDPFGGRYEWDAAWGEVRSSANPFRFRLREGSHHPRFQYKSPLERSEGSR
jgi:tetratricopeptide (TPR) repeat protein